MPGVFISYRRSDSSTISGRIYDHLVNVYGEDQVFKDVYDIPAGSDFRKVIEEGIDACEVQLIIIGPNWLNAQATDGSRRLDSPSDFVRIEIEAGLACKVIRLIPVLVGGASMPSAAELPESIRELAYHNAITIRDDPDFRSDIQRLITSLRLRFTLDQGQVRSRRTILSVLGVVIVLVLLFIGARTLMPSVFTVAAVPTPTATPTATSTSAPTEAPTATPLTATEITTLLPMPTLVATIAPLRTRVIPFGTFVLPVRTLAISTRGVALVTLVSPFMTTLVMPPQLLEQGIALQDQARYSDAVKLFDTAIGQNPNDADFYYQRGYSYHKLGDYAHALADLTHALELAPSDADSFFERGWIHYDNGEFALAIDDFDRVIALAPASADGYLGRGTVYRDSANFDQAFADYDQAIRFASSSSTAYYERGYAHQLNDEIETALADFSQALVLDPDNGQALLQTAFIENDRKEWGSALEHAQRAAELLPDNPFVYLALGDIYYNQGFNSEALENYRRYAALIGADVSSNISRRIAELAAAE